jgi:hypothetical protein
MKILKHLSVLPALLAMGLQASAAPACTAEAATALKTAAIQQEMMVAAFSCGDTQAYNRFVLANQPGLQKSDAALMAYFKTRDSSEAGYDAYKTKVANLVALRSARDTAGFCASLNASFAAAEGKTLERAVADENLLVTAPDPCLVVREDIVAGVPSHDLPIMPYGKPEAAPTAPDVAAADTYETREASAWNAPRYAPAGGGDGFDPRLLPRPRRYGWVPRYSYRGY